MLMNYTRLQSHGGVDLLISSSPYDGWTCLPTLPRLQVVRQHVTLLCHPCITLQRLFRELLHNISVSCKICELPMNRQVVTLFNMYFMNKK